MAENQSKKTGGDDRKRASDVTYHDTSLCDSDRIGSGTRIWAYTHIMDGATVGRDCNICDHVFIESGASIGDRVTIKNRALLFSGINIANDVFIGPGVVFTNDRYPRSPRMPAAAARYATTEAWLEQTHVGEGVSIGAGAIIGAGLRIAKFATIGAGAVLTKDVTPHAIVVGNPARAIGWSCRCGVSLDRALKCRSCLRRYKLNQGNLTEIIASLSPVIFRGHAQGKRAEGTARPAALGATPTLSSNARPVVLLGKGSLAIQIAEWFFASPDHDLVAVVPVVPEPQWTQSLIDWCVGHGIPHAPSGHFRDVNSILGHFDSTRTLALSVFYDKILPITFLDRFAMALNLHNAPLPKYRGIAPINWALKNEETMHGVTIHQITPEIDAGPIVSQVHFSIFPETDEVVDVYRRSLKFGYELFKQTIPNIDQIKPVAQASSEASYYSQMDVAKLGLRSNFTRAMSVEARKPNDKGAAARIPLEKTAAIPPTTEESSWS